MASGLRSCAGWKSCSASADSFGERAPENSQGLFLSLHLQMKNPLKVMISEGPIIKTLASVAFSVVGGTGFEPATSTV